MPARSSVGTALALFRPTRANARSGRRAVAAACGWSSGGAAVAGAEEGEGFGVAVGVADEGVQPFFDGGGAVGGQRRGCGGGVVGGVAPVSGTGVIPDP